jgi:hypothetical protein
VDLPHRFHRRGAQRAAGGDRKRDAVDGVHLGALEAKPRNAGARSRDAEPCARQPCIERIDFAQAIDPEQRLAVLRPNASGAVCCGDDAVVSRAVLIATDFQQRTA